MKASNLQRLICDTLIDTIRYWKDSNDISSPTASSDIDDCQTATLLDEIEDSDLNLLNNYMHNVYNIVRKYDQESNEG